MFENLVSQKTGKLLIKDIKNGSKLIEIETDEIYDTIDRNKCRIKYMIKRAGILPCSFVKLWIDNVKRIVEKVIAMSIAENNSVFPDR